MVIGSVLGIGKMVFEFLIIASFGSHGFLLILFSLTIVSGYGRSFLLAYMLGC